MLSKIGSDVSKDTIDIYLIATKRHFKIANNEKGYQKFVDKLPDRGAYHICMEATGNYYEDFADYLSINGYYVSVINPLKIREYARSKFSRTKTDKQDAKLIAQYCEEHKPKADYKVPTEEQYQIKRLISHIKQLNYQKVSIKNRIKSSKDNFVTAQLQKQLQDTNDYLKECNNRLVMLSDKETTTNIDSIPGIGETTAAILSYYLSYYGFETANKFCAFAGLCPIKHESGKSVKKRDKLSVIGNRTVKTALYMPAVVAYRIGLYQSLVDRLKAKGKSSKVIIVAIMRKLACLAFTLWQRGEAYKIKEERALSMQT